MSEEKRKLIKELTEVKKKMYPKTFYTLEGRNGDILYDGLSRAYVPLHSERFRVKELEGISLNENLSSAMLFATEAEARQYARKINITLANTEKEKFSKSEIKIIKEEKEEIKEIKEIKEKENKTSVPENESRDVTPEPEDECRDMAAGSGYEDSVLILSRVSDAASSNSEKKKKNKKKKDKTKEKKEKKKGKNKKRKNKKGKEKNRLVKK